jgi:hypothetical protein
MTETRWIPIASRARRYYDDGDKNEWVPEPNAPMDAETARNAAKAGKLYAMTRHDPDECVLLIAPLPGQALTVPPSLGAALPTMPYALKPKPNSAYQRFQDQHRALKAKAAAK